MKRLKIATIFNLLLCLAIKNFYNITIQFSCMKLAFEKQILIGFIASICMVLGIAFASYIGIENLRNNAELVEHTYKVIRTVKNVEKSMLDVETGGRGYLLTQVDSFLQPFNEGKARVFIDIAELKSLTSDNSNQQKRIELLTEFVKAKVSDQGAKIEIEKKKGIKEAISVMAQGKGKILMDRVRKVCGNIIDEENQLLHERNKKAEHSAKLAILIVFIGTFLIASLVLLLILYIRSAFSQRKQAEEQLILSNKELEKVSEENRYRNYLLKGGNELSEILRGENEIEELSQNIIQKVCNYTGAQVGALYINLSREKILELAAAYAYDKNNEVKRIAHGEGLVGQVAIDRKKIWFTEVPPNYMKISSSLGNIQPKNILVNPVLYNNELKAVLEIGFANSISRINMDFIDQVSESIAVAINSVQYRLQMHELYEKTQEQSQELEAQQEELRQTNNELTAQTHLLQTSEEELRVQQEELQQINNELEEKAQLLEEKNKIVEESREALSIKAEELEATSKYKSEFLANMSHELRTPLNSILILAKLLVENKFQNLNEKQIEFAKIIHRSGHDLLNLIDDILDLSKIEAGKMELNITEAHVEEIGKNIKSLFEELARQKEIQFSVSVSEDVPEVITTDRVRLEQMLKNLLSNAFKFTPKGGAITLKIKCRSDKQNFRNEFLNKAPSVIAFEVKDTGIGISLDKQKLIFEAFQQADGSTNRKYGGTGLGLSISKEISLILQGEIQVESEENKGSTFSVFLPATYDGKKAEPNNEKRETIQEPAAPVYNNKTILIIEDDLSFAHTLASFADERGFKTLVAPSGNTGLQYAEEYKPQAILLDIQLPDVDGWTVLKRLKDNPATRGIHVHIISGTDNRKLGEELGAMTYLLKPVDTGALEEIFRKFNEAPLKSILLVEDNEEQSQSMMELIKSREENVIFHRAFSAEEALEVLPTEHFDCIIVDLGLQKVSGFELIERIRAQEEFKKIPLIVYTGKDLDVEEEARLKRNTDAIVLKSERSFDRLLDETALFLHKLVHEPKVLNASVQPRELLKGKTVILADDDIRNIFALSTALESYGVDIIPATDGLECLRKLKEHRTVDMVLIDIMMPEMDGYEAIRRIRLQPQFKTLPVIALTAKAMQGDRDKCLEAGASDYISKPVNLEKLVSLMRVWLYK